jgi:hypothetical protein
MRTLLVNLRESLKWLPLFLPLGSGPKIKFPKDTLLRGLAPEVNFTRNEALFRFLLLSLQNELEKNA